MSVRKVFASVAVVAAVAGAGLMTASTAQAAPPTAAAQSVGPANWVPRGDYASRGECNIVGDWFVRWGGASNYTCSLNAATQRFDLAIWRP
ncbi:hypothetical protein GT204_35195 [Streptomyces sp. SID4919]|uniref:hypothetical protein n=1 Tax=unclassified Streptomyces TaxID=2593676 RepID=UPI000823C5C1|nr:MULTISPECIES: hypothetical protein [unclassified Streptomyces]MYY13977.1 hypothetical protein [Streptomyces sp. SID4919]SCK31882.1 hypothetical protein YW7DRAFT_02565 [Streptomyces sp. AmelKG-E11A]